jgi:peptidoglycan/LPS O-acetylase OafA/YrhL
MSTRPRPHGAGRSTSGDQALLSASRSPAHGTSGSPRPGIASHGMDRLGHRPELDGVRGLAIILVVGGHCLGLYQGWATRGVLGVDLFFVLSGFLITTLLVEEWQRDNSLNLREFYVRRGRRLLPALGALVGVFALLTLVALPSRAPETGLEAILRVSYVANFFIAFTQNGVGFGFEHLWSLAQEEQFYLLWPPVLYVLLRRRVSPKRLLLLLGVAILAVNLQRLAVVATGGERHRIWFAPDTHSDAILFGCAAALAWKHRLLRLPSARWTWGIVAALFLCSFAGFDLHAPSSYPYALPLFALACAVGIIALLENSKALVPRIFATRPMQGMGKVSYSLYLWHAPLIAFFGIAGMPVAFAASVLSYLYVEEPFRRRSRSTVALRAQVTPAR